MLKSSPPEKSIPQTALTVNTQFEKKAKSAGKEPELQTVLLAGVYLVQDLVEIGNNAGIFEIPTEEMGTYLQATIQEYVQKGLKDGTIDPVELQAAIEPMMEEQHKALGMEAAGRTGIPLEANQQTAMESYGSQRERKATDRAANKAVAKAGPVAPGMLQGGQ